MKMSELKKGDIISNVRYGFKLHKAKVINNFPSKNKIYLKYIIFVRINSG